jgi:membrane associated rhomboid family serine protease
MSQEEEFKKFKYSLVLPLFFIFVLWIIKTVEFIGHFEFFRFGVYPRNINGLYGIILSPLIHADFNHLLSNTPPLLILGTGIIFFYRELAYKVIGFVWLISGICVWVGARESYHIGASGLIYGLAAFLFLSGLIRRDFRLAAISLLVVFLYGSLVWGVFPIFPQISWEYHLFGGLSGLVAALIYRNKGPKPKEWSWEREEDVNEEDYKEDLNNNTIE